MTTTTLTRLPSFGESLSAAVSSVLAALTRAADSSPRTASELLELADRYEPTQPSFAADLRAAAWRAQP